MGFIEQGANGMNATICQLIKDGPGVEGTRLLRNKKIINIRERSTSNEKSMQEEDGDRERKPYLTKDKILL